MWCAKSDVVWRKSQETLVLLNTSSGLYYTVNPTGAMLWTSLVEKQESFDQAVKGIQEQTKSVIEIEEDGTIMISSTGGSEGHLTAKSIIENMTTPPQVGRVYENARVVTVKEFGAFVEMTPGVEGLCHISELSDGYIKSVDEVCKVGDHISVKLIAIDDQGRFKLSRKAVLIGDNPEGQSQDQGQGGQGQGGGRPRRDEKNRSGHRPPNKPRV